MSKQEKSEFVCEHWQMFRRTVHNFAQRELEPGARQRAKREQVDRQLVRRLGEVGLLGLKLPEKYGGQPADFVSIGIAVEEISKVDFALGWLPTQIGRIIEVASSETQEEWLPAFISGQKICCLGVTEPNHGSDVAGIETRAERRGSEYVISGEKTSVSFGMVADAMVIAAKTNPDAGTRGISCFLIPLDVPGISRFQISDMGGKPVGRASITFDRVSIPSRYLIGGEGKGFYEIMSQFDFVRVCMALVGLGTAQRCLADTIEYAKQRFAFGKPIAKFESVSFKIAEHVTRIEAARLLCYRTLLLRDYGRQSPKDAAMCKWFCPKVAVDAIHDCLLIYGHIGYSEELPIEQRFRDVIGLEMADGTAEIMKIIIARELIGKEFAP